MSDDLQTPETEPAHPTLPERVEEIERKVEETVEGAVDKVAEGVAEHVPEPIREKVRWTVKRLVLVIGLAVVLSVILAAGISAYYVWNHTEWAAHELTGRVNSVLLERSDVKLSLRGVSGNPLSSVLVSEPRVTFRDNGVVLLAARSMRLRYSTWDLLTARHRAIVLELDHPIVNLTRNPDGKLRLPTWKTSAQAAGAPRSYDFGIRIRGGDVLMPENEQSVVGFDLDAAVATGGPTRLEVASLKWQRGPYGMRLDGLRGGIQVGDSVHVEIRELASPEIALQVAGRWARDGPRHLAGEVQHVRWAWLAKMFQNNTLDVPGQGTFTFHADENGGWSGDLAGHGVWSDLPFQARGHYVWRDNRFTMDHLAGTTPAGVMTDGRLMWSKQGWQVGGDATDANPARWAVLGLKDWPAGKLRGRFVYAVQTRGAAHPGRLDARLAASQWAGWNADSAQVRVEFPAFGPDTFAVAAWRRVGSLQLLGKSEGGGWTGRYHIERFPLDEWPDGRASGLKGLLTTGDGTVAGRAGTLDVTGDLEGSDAKWFGIDAARWRLAEVKGRLLPTPDLDAKARLEHSFYLGIHFDSAGTPVHLGNQTLAMTDLKAWASDTLITMSAGADWTAHAWRMVATRAEAQSHQFHWIADPPLELAGNDQGVTFQRLEAADGEARLHVGGRWAVPGGSYDWHASAERLRLDRLGLPADLGLTGTADAALAVRGIAGDPRWEFQGVARLPALQGHRADSLTLALAGAPARLDVRDFRLAVNGGRVQATGSVDQIRPAWPDTLTPSGIVSWLAGGGRWQGQARADSLPLESLARVAKAEGGWTGRLATTLNFSGSPASPRIDAEVRARPVSWHNVRLDEMQARASYADQRLRVTEFRTRRDQSVSSVTGEMQLALALGKVPQVLDAPMHWRVDLPNGDLALVPALVPQIGYANGRFEVNGDVSGTPRHPKLVGTARVRNGRMRMAGRAEVLEDVRANLRLSDDRITVDSLVAVQNTRQGEPGRVSGHGVVELHPGHSTYAFDLSLRDFTAVEEGLYAARFDGDFHIADGVRVAGQVLPHVTSTNVEIRRAVILYDFARQTEQQQVQASTQPLLWTYSIQLHANDNLRWQPPDGNIEFSADLSVEQTPDKLIIFGDMDALRGTYYFLSNTFTVRTAKLTFDDVGGVDPLVDAEAFTRLVPTQIISSRDVNLASSDRKPSQHTITVKIQGRSSRPAVQFVDEPSNPLDPQLDEAQVLQELTVGRFAPGQQISPLDPFDSYFTRVISRQLSAELSRAFRGYISDWEIARESSGVPGGGNLMVRVGSQLNDRIAVRYGQVLPGTGRTNAPTTGAASTLIERDIEAEYRLNRFFYITSQITQKRPVAGTTTTTTSTPDFNVNLKARWEY